MKLIAALVLILMAATVQPATAQEASGEDAAATATQEAPADDAEAPATPPSALLPAAADPSQPLETLQLLLLPMTKADLEALAAEYLAIVKGKTEEVVAATLAAREAEGAAAAAARERALALAEERNRLFENYAAVVSSWEAKGGDAAAIAEYRAYRNAIVVDEIRTSGAMELASRTWRWLTSPDGGLGLVLNVAIVVLAFAALIVVARIVRAFTGRGIRRVPNLSRLLQAFVLVAVYWLTIAVGLMVVLSALGINITPLFALVGGASFILAFALQETLGNLAAGLMIMVNRPFDEGDYVDIAGTAGTVKTMSIVSTTVTTPDNQVITIPNGKVWGNVITNVTGSDVRRVDLVFGVGYGETIETVQGVLEEVISAHPLTLDNPAPMVRVNALSDSSVDFIARPWVKTADYWTVYWDLMRAVKERFDAEGITIPFPQRDVHVHGASAPAAIAAQ